MRRTSATGQILLIFGEGLGEAAFLKHLKKTYNYDKDIAVMIRKGKGGTADGLIIEAANSLGDFTRRIVVLDNDKDETEMVKAREEGSARNIELLENTPCLEAVLLLILEAETPQNKGSGWYKNTFESKYIARKERDEPAEYVRVFPRAVLEKERLRVSELNKLIDLLEGKS